MHRYQCWNAAAPTTAAMVSVTTGTSIKAMLQISTPSTRQIQVLSWGYQLSAAPASGTGQIELIQVDVAASAGTAHVAAGVQPLDPNAPASLMTLGTANTGYSFATLNSPTATRSFDQSIIPAAAASAGVASLDYYKDFMPDERPIIAVSKFLQVRVTFTAAVLMSTFIAWDE